MRLTSQIIRERATGPLPSLEYLDLSNLNLAEIEKLGLCKKLQYLDLHGNNLQDVNNLQYSRNLWSVNLSCNKLQCLDGLSRFLCFGELILSNNDLSWKELVKIRHIHILNLSLHGNPQLEKDQYYRIHVIDCLPNVWMLDGRIVTSAERIQVKNFFQDSALSEHPVRRKLTRDWFITSAMKNIELTGLFGQKAASVLTKFPVSAVHNIELDKKRLLYLAYNLQEDINVEQKATKRKYEILKHKKDFVEEILKVRNEEREKCNMLLIILVASLEFILPTHLVQETLAVAKLQKMGKVHTMDLFFLPRDIRCKVVSVLLSAVKIDKDIKENGGLYDKLYLCLFYAICELTKISQSKTVNTHKPNKYHALHKEYRSLLAAEITQLLCIVPDLFDYVEKDLGIINILTIATGDNDISMILTQHLHLATLQGRDRERICEELSEIILKLIETNMMNLSNSTPRSIESDVIINKMKALPIKEVNLALYNSDFLMKGLPSPEHSYIKHDPTQPIPELGDEILLGPQIFHKDNKFLPASFRQEILWIICTHLQQTIGKIMSLPQPGIALISIDQVPVSNGSMESKLKDQEDHYTYINMNYLHWENHSQMWKPRGTVGDNQNDQNRQREVDHSKRRFTIQSIESFQQELEGNTEVSNETYRPNSPADCFPLASGAGSYRPTEPLIYTPKQYTPCRTHTAPNKTHKVPRPMSSVFKDKLDLKLDITKRPKSAVTLRSSSPRSRRSHKMADQKVVDANTQNGDHVSFEGQGCNHGDDVRQKSNGDVVNKELKDVESVNAVKSSIETKSPTGVFITAGNDVDQETSVTSVDQYITNMVQSCMETALDSFREGPTEQTKTSTVNELEKQPLSDKDSCVMCVSENNKPESNDKNTPRSHSALDHDQLSRENMSNRPYSAHQSVPNSQPPADRKSPIYTEIQVQIPKFEIEDSESARSRESDIHQQKGGKKEKIEMTRQPIKTRPFSAVNAYKTFVQQPSFPLKYRHGNRYRSDFQNGTSESLKVTGKTKTENPPPQRPPSPVNKGTSNNKLELRITRANNWLAGGRDVHKEMTRNRPKSGHVPGWKEGLPQTLARRPKSAMVPRSGRQSQILVALTPTSIYEYGSAYGSTDLPELPSLSDYPSSIHHSPSPRILGTLPSNHYLMP